MNIAKLIEQKRKAKEKKVRVQKAKTLSIGLTAGALAGALSGILLAPKSGKETRDDIKNTANDLNVKIKDKTTEVSEVAKTNILDARTKIQDYLKSKKEATTASTDSEEIEVSSEEVATDNISEVEEI